MKLAIIASAAAAVATVTNAAVCDVTSLQTLLTSPDTTTCATESSYSVTSLATPTRAQLDIMCVNAACQSVLSQIRTLAPTECTLGTFSLYANLINPLTSYCAGNGTLPGGLLPGGSSSGSSSGSSALSDVIVPSDSTTPDVKGSSPTASNDQTNNPDTSTADASGASMATISAGAFVVALAATFF